MGHWDDRRAALLLGPGPHVPAGRSVVRIVLGPDLPEPSVPGGGHRPRAHHRRAGQVLRHAAGGHDLRPPHAATGSPGPTSTAPSRYGSSWPVSSGGRTAAGGAPRPRLPRPVDAVLHELESKLQFTADVFGVSLLQAPPPCARHQSVLRPGPPPARCPPQHRRPELRRLLGGGAPGHATRRALRGDRDRRRDARPRVGSRRCSSGATTSTAATSTMWPRRRPSNPTTCSPTTLPRATATTARASACPR